MTILELLKQNHSKYCYRAGIITESLEAKDGKRVEAKLAEVWRIPVTILNKEITLK